VQADADPNAHKAAALRLIAEHRYVEAIAECRRAVDLAPDRADLWGNLGYAAIHAGDSATAEAAYRKAAELDPQGPYCVAARSGSGPASGRKPSGASVDWSDLAGRGPTDAPDGSGRTGPVRTSAPQDEG
jgi:tetratricopeptide (TPR) repeat protein